MQTPEISKLLFCENAHIVVGKIVFGLFSIEKLRLDKVLI